MTPNPAPDATDVPERSVVAARTGDFLHILRRRWFTVAVAIAVVAGASYAYSSTQAPRYAASADVLLSRQNLAASLNNISDPGLVTGDLNRAAQTQANLATAPAVIRLALKSAGLPQSQANEFQSSSSVTAKPTADILTFRVEDPNPAQAVRLSDAYARSYTSYRRTLDSAGIELALTRVRQRLKDLRAVAHPNQKLITSLSDNEDRLNTLGAFQASNAFLVRSPDRAAKVSPRPKRALILGLFFGALLGIGIVMLRHRLDTRLEDPSEVAAQLGMPLLATIPELPRKLRESHELVMLSDPGSGGSETFRVLRMNVEFATVDGDTKTIMVSSAVQTEGKSTTLANLALAFARAGRRVVLVDLDLRRPYVHKFFDLGGRPGFTDVALGRVGLRDALVDIDITSRRSSSAARTEGIRPAPTLITADDQRSRGSLRVLPSGPMPPDTGEFVASERVKQILRDVEIAADVVLIDAPPLLSVSDALALSRVASAVLLVARLGIVRRPMIKEARRVLESCPARVLGCVVTGVPPNQSYTYGYGYAYKSTNTPVQPVVEDATARPRRMRRGRRAL